MRMVSHCTIRCILLNQMHRNYIQHLVFKADVQHGNDQAQHRRRAVPDLVRGLPGYEGAHPVHGSIAADVGDVIAAVALAQICQVLEVNIIRDLDLLQATWHKTETALFCLAKIAPSLLCGCPCSGA